MDLRPLAGKRILVVEDEFLVAELLCARLANAGAVLVAPTDRSSVALAFIATEQLDGAVLDFMLADGITSTLALDELPSELRNAPYLEKPVHPDRLVELATRTFADKPPVNP
jgi:CheY-like chemotaxis protein